MYWSDDTNGYVSVMSALLVFALICVVVGLVKTLKRKQSAPAQPEQSVWPEEVRQSHTPEEARAEQVEQSYPLQGEEIPVPVFVVVPPVRSFSSIAEMFEHIKAVEDEYILDDFEDASEYFDLHVDEVKKHLVGWQYQEPGEEEPAR